VSGEGVRRIRTRHRVVHLLVAIDSTPT
jgi:hypothetical protein